MKILIEILNSNVVAAIIGAVITLIGTKILNNKDEKDTKEFYDKINREITEFKKAVDSRLNYIEEHIEERLLLRTNLLQKAVEYKPIVRPPLIAHLRRIKILFSNHTIETGHGDQRIEIVESQVATIQEGLVVVSVSPQLLRHKG